MTPLQLKPILPEHESQLFDMLYLALFVPAGQPELPRSILEDPNIRRYACHWGRDGDFGLMFEIEGRCLSAAWVRRFPREAPGYGFVEETLPELSIATQPEYRGQGLGMNLLTHLFEKVRQSSIGVSLSVSWANPARLWYERLGFVVHEQKADSVIMVKYF